MSKDKQIERRNFIKKTSLAALSIGLLPVLPKTVSAKSRNSESCNPTTVDYYGEGPFYTQNPPLMNNNVLAKNTEPGTRMVISGRVTNLDCTEFIPNAIIDVWHADDSGNYDNAGYNLRGQTKTNSQGYFVFETIKPGKYLNGTQYRPSHIHFKITAPNKPVLTTQLYFQGDSSIPIDAAASIKSGNYDATNRIIPLIANTNGILEGTWDIVVAGEGEKIKDVGIVSQHIHKGMLYKTYPNPFTNELYINYGVFKDSRISVSIYDLKGNLVTELKNEFHSAGKYHVKWKPDVFIPTGYYFISLKMNDMQIHYLKVEKI